MDVSELIELALALARGGCGMSVTGRRGGGGEAASWQRGDTRTQETQGRSHSPVVSLSCGPAAPDRRRHRAGGQHPVPV